MFYNRFQQWRRQLCVMDGSAKVGVLGETAFNVTKSLKPRDSQRVLSHVGSPLEMVIALCKRTHACCSLWFFLFYSPNPSCPSGSNHFKLLVRADAFSLLWRHEQGNRRVKTPQLWEALTRDSANGSVVRISEQRVTLNRAMHFH